MKGNTLVFIYNSFKDPLFQNLMLSYLKTLAPNRVGKFYLITFEQVRYRMSKEEKLIAKKELAKIDIFWLPLKFHTGKFLLLKKAWDLLCGFLLVSWIRIRYRTQIIFCFANVSASFGYVFSRFLNMKLMVYSYEPHSEFMVDLGYWSSSDFKYRILNKLEWKAGMHADVIMTGTKWMVEELQRRGSNAKLFRAPTAVDPNIFKPSPELRKSIRKKIMIENHERVFIYVGKFGGLYYEEGIPRLCKHIFENIDSCKFLIVTSNDHKEISALFSKYLPTDSFIITGNLSQEDLLGCLNAADFGISGVPPSPNQKYRSPTKVAEYMLIGLPYITTSGVAEDDIYAIKHQIGVVTPDFNMAPDPPFYKTIEGLLLEEKTDQVDRIRRVGIEYRSKERIDELLRKIYGI